LECLETRTLPSANITPFYALLPPQNGSTPMTSSGPTGLSPSQIAKAYGFNQINFTSNGTSVAANGSGQTIAIVNAYNDPTIASDLQAFDQTYGLPNANLTVLNQNGGTSLPGVDPSGGWEVEESLDVEWAHAIAPGANIVFVEANSNNFSDLLTAVQTAAAYPGVAAVSMSWGGGEFNGENSYDSYFATPSGHSGVVFIASSGDSGAPVSYPAISSNVLSVGGTTLSLDSSGNYQGESAWSGSGGGISAYEPLPSYQPGTYSNGSSTGTSTMRMNPDVAYDANPGTGFSVYDSYNYGTAAPWITVGGTSDAAPQWAGLVAITDQGRAIQGESALNGAGQLLPMLYKLPGDFHDITSGSSTGSPNYTAGTGYDLTTGLGTPIANYLVRDLISLAALSGTASFVKTDTTTEGNWQGVYGSQGYNVIDDATSYPSYAQISPSGNSTWVWNSSTTDPRALQDVGSTNRVAACWYAGTSSGQGFTVNVNLTDGQTHQLALYLLDWDQWGGGRSEQVQIVNSSTGQVLDTESVSNFGNGEYLVWNVSGDIQVRITSTDSFGSAVLSGLFIDPAGSPPASGTASFVKTDTTTEGNWQGVYGSQGYNVIDNASSYPNYAQISPNGNSTWVWNSSTTDPRGLQDVGSNSRIAACWYAGTGPGQGFTVNVNLTDGQTHQLALYLLDWDQWGGGRSEQVQIVNASTGQVLDTESVSNFSNGEYLVWNVSGDIQIRITSTDSFGSAVLSGLFLG
jgi:hypothetical protein